MSQLIESKKCEGWVKCGHQKYHHYTMGDDNTKCGKGNEFDLKKIKMKMFALDSLKAKSKCKLCLANLGYKPMQIELQTTPKSI